MKVTANNKIQYALHILDEKLKWRLAVLHLSPSVSKAGEALLPNVEFHSMLSSMNHGKALLYLVVFLLQFFSRYFTLCCRLHREWRSWKVS